MINLYLLFLCVPIIGLVDYFIFANLYRCPCCGSNSFFSWYSFIIPTFIECVLFLAGIAIGISFMMK